MQVDAQVWGRGYAVIHAGLSESDRAEFIAGLRELALLSDADPCDRMAACFGLLYLDTIRHEPCPTLETERNTNGLARW